MSVAAEGRLRVVSVIHPFRPAFSGEGEWWLHMAPPLRARGIDVEILTTVAHNGSGERGDTAEGVPVRRVRPTTNLPEYPARISAILRSLFQDRRRLNIALFHSPNYDAVYASCVAGRALGWKTIYKATLNRADDLETIQRTGRMGRVRARLLRLADGIVAMSDVMVRGLADAQRDRLLVVPQGIDTSRFRPRSAQEQAALRRALGLDPDGRVALFCGAIVWRKGVDVLVDAWEQVRRELPDAHLLMAGPTHRDGLDEPEYRAFSQAIENRIHALGLADRIQLLGMRRDTERLYGAADLFVFPSRNEGWGSVISEAMASGLPCVLATMDGIARDHLQDGREGVIVESESPAKYAASIVELLRDDERRRAMGERARARIMERVTLDLVADRYAAFFRRIAHGQASAGAAAAAGDRPSLAPRAR